MLRRERPDALLPTMGGQTALNLARELAQSGILDELGIELIGANLEVIQRAEDRQLFKVAVESCGCRSPISTIVIDPDAARRGSRRRASSGLHLRSAATAAVSR